MVDLDYTFEETYFDYPIQMVLVELLLILGFMTPLMFSWNELGVLEILSVTVSAILSVNMTAMRTAQNFLRTDIGGKDDE